MRVAYPFGFGLSYTEFTYSSLTVDAQGAEFTLKNTGSMDGAETAQMYVGRKDAKVFRPEKELKGFCKVFLKAGESRKIRIPSTIRHSVTGMCGQINGRWKAGLTPS